MVAAAAVFTTDVQLMTAWHPFMVEISQVRLKLQTLWLMCTCARLSGWLCSSDRCADANDALVSMSTTFQSDSESSVAPKRRRCKAPVSV
jgi:hypothetical protein